ncbi:phage tail protein [Aliifodinibius salicampi]|uniref:Phage tail protein n=1 Tax=Fodinibius salicampi TaxID=1920655 RepID=A0ABT3PZ00_9BACT|nr:phage tail protein [Fodinibius salicampi]MCW9713087.1 phage tail protein [Fodinibius salicampi]
MAESYPPVSFYYQVSFNGIGDNAIDTRFQSVSGLSAEVKTETYKEGGENRFEHVLPVRSSYSDITLKRGLATDSKLIKWFTDTFDTMQVQPVTIDIMLLNEEGDPLVSWNLVHAWPKKWSISDFDAEQNAIAIETLELHYRTFSINM